MKKNEQYIRKTDKPNVLKGFKLKVMYFFVQF